MTKLISINPASNYSIIGELEISSESGIKKKVALARKALKGWVNVGIEERVKLLQKVSDTLYRRRKEISRLAYKEMGFFNLVELC